MEPSPQGHGPSYSNRSASFLMDMEWACCKAIGLGFSEGFRVSKAFVKCIFMVSTGIENMLTGQAEHTDSEACQAEDGGQ